MVRARSTSPGRRRAPLAGLIGSAIALGGVAAAWACTEQAAIFTRPMEGPAGSEVVVRGIEFPEGPVELRWDTAAGEIVGTAEGPAFRTVITVPRTAVGSHTIVAFSADATYVRRAVLAGFARAPFLVTEPVPDVPSSRNDDPARGGDRAPRQEPARPAESSQQASVHVGGVVQHAGAPPARRHDDGPSGTVGRSASRVSGMSDLWTGFRSSSPSLVPGLMDGVGAVQPSPYQVQAGAYLFAAGLLVLFAGALVAAAQRRRAAAVAGENGSATTG